MCLRGKCESWFQGADARVRAVASTVNGPLLEALARASEFADRACIEYFREGALLLGVLPHSGIGENKTFPEPVPVSSSRRGLMDANIQTVAQLREDRHSARLLEAAVEDADAQRMSYPRMVAGSGESEVLLSPRFGVEQGRQACGNIKIRPVDDLSTSGVNASCQPVERNRHDSMDSLFELTKFLCVSTGTCVCWHALSPRVAPRCTFVAGTVPHLMKADVDSAFRRVPIAPAHRWAAAVAWLVGGEVLMAEHWAMPFGALASVFAWERIGALLCHLGRRLLRIPLLRYTDGLLFWS